MLYVEGQSDPDLGNFNSTSAIGCLRISPFRCLEIHQLHGVRKSLREETGLFTVTGKASDNHNNFHRHLRPHFLHWRRGREQAAK